MHSAWAKPFFRRRRDVKSLSLPLSLSICLSVELDCARQAAVVLAYSWRCLRVTIKAATAPRVALLAARAIIALFFCHYLIITRPNAVTAITTDHPEQDKHLSSLSDASAWLFSSVVCWFSHLKVRTYLVNIVIVLCAFLETLCRQSLQ